MIDLKNAELIVLQLQPHVQLVEDAYIASKPDELMRSAYKLLREIRASKNLTQEKFDEFYQALDELSDSLNLDSASRRQCVKDCIEKSNLLGSPGHAMTALIDKIDEKALPEFHRPHATLYDWALEVFSSSKGYSWHIMQSKDERPRGIKASQQASACKRTNAVMDEILTATAMPQIAGISRLSSDIKQIKILVEKLKQIFSEA